MEKELNSILLPPLKQISLRRLVIMLWNEIDVLSRLEVFGVNSSEDLPLTLNIEIELVKNKLSQLTLPKLLIDEATSLIAPVGSMIQKWQKFHIDFLIYPHTYFEKRHFHFPIINFDRRILEKLCWTPMGTVNYQKTAEELIRHEMLEPLVLYKLACWYCLEDYIPSLFENLDGWVRERFYERLFTQSRLDAFWTVLLRDDEEGYNAEDYREQLFENTTDFYQHAFMKSANTGNVAAVKYFYQKLTNEERELTLFKTAQDIAIREYPDIIYSYFEDRPPIENFSNVLCYLLSQMSSEQQMELLKTRPYGALTCFAEWPWLDLFFYIAELVWDFLPANDYYRLLKHIGTFQNILGRLNVELFREFFRRSPRYLKNVFIDQECLEVGALCSFFCYGESETIKFIFRNMDSESKSRLVFSNPGVIIYEFLIESHNWQLLKLFILEAMLSKEEMERIKKSMTIFYIEANCDCTLTEFEQFINSLDESEA